MVHFYNLCLEYWHPKILSDLAWGFGVPLKIYRRTFSSDFDHYAHLLVNINLAITVPTSLVLDKEGVCSKISLVC